MTPQLHEGNACSSTKRKTLAQILCELSKEHGAELRSPMRGSARDAHSRMKDTAALPSGVGQASRTSLRTNLSKGTAYASNSDVSRSLKLAWEREGGGGAQCGARQRNNTCF